MWNNYPKHELEKIKILKPFEVEREIKENRKVTNPKASYQKDYMNEIFKIKKNMDDQ